MNNQLEHPVYNYKVVRQFTIMTVVWGVIGMAIGVLIAAQLASPDFRQARRLCLLGLATGYRLSLHIAATGLHNV